MARNLILTGGIYHPFAEASAALSGLLAEHGVESRTSEDIEGGLAGLASAEYELLTIYALRWRMTQHEKYAPFRAQWAMSLSPVGRAAIGAHLARGGGLLALHTAVICFDDWPEWPAILGGGWVWGRSGHPPYGRVTARPTAAAHPITRSLGPFELDDEVYGNLDLAADVTPLAEAAPADGAGGWQPALWARAHGGGRVVFDALGHDAGAFTHSVHRRIVTRAALWALGRPDREIEAI
jgi:hypothetical protein